MKASAPVWRDLGDNDGDAIWDLVTACGFFPHYTHADFRRLLAWLIGTNPWNDGSVPLGVGAFSDDRLVGLFLNLPLPFAAGTWRGTVSSGICFSVDPNHRGTLGLSLVNRFLGQPGAQSMVLFHMTGYATKLVERAGGVMAEGSDLKFSGVIDLGRYARRALRQRNPALARLAPRLPMAWAARACGIARASWRPRVSWHSPEWDAPLLDECWQQRAARGVVGLDRTGAYLRWRYRDAPGAGNYRLISVPSGFAVIETPEQPDGAAIVLEFVTDPNTAEAAPGLLAAACECALDMGAATLEGRAGTRELATLMEQAGFRLSRSAYPQCSLRVPASTAGLEAHYFSGEHRPFPRP